MRSFGTASCFLFAFFAQHLEKRNKFSLLNFAIYHILPSCKSGRVNYKRSLKSYDSFLKKLVLHPSYQKNSTGSVHTLMFPGFRNSCYFYDKQILKKEDIQLLPYQKIVKICTRILLGCICK